MLNLQPIKIDLIVTCIKVKYHSLDEKKRQTNILLVLIDEITKKNSRILIDLEFTLHQIVSICSVRLSLGWCSRSIGMWLCIWWTMLLEWPFRAAIWFSKFCQWRCEKGGQRTTMGTIAIQSSTRLPRYVDELYHNEYEAESEKKTFHSTKTVSCQFYHSYYLSNTNDPVNSHHKPF